MAQLKNAKLQQESLHGSETESLNSTLSILSIPDSENSEDEDNEIKSTIPMPIEIIDIILSYVDGMTLMKCRRVSKSVKSLIDGPTISAWKKWAQVCTEIPDEQLLLILEKYRPKYWMDNETRLEWSVVYKRWVNWLHFLKLKNKKFKRIVSNFKEITDIKASGSYIFVGTKLGEFIAVSLKDKSKQLICKYGPIKTISLRCTTETAFLSTNKTKNVAHDEALLDTESLKVLQINLRNNLISTLGKLSENLHQYGCFEDHIVIGDVGAFSSSYKSVCPDGTSVRDFDDCIQLLTVFNGRILLMAKYGKMMTFDKKFNYIRHPMNDTYVPYESHVRRHFIGLEAILSYSYCNSPPFQVNFKGAVREYFFPFDVCSCLYYIGHLFLGTTTGTIEVFYLEELQKLLHLDAVPPKFREKLTVPQLGENPVIAMDVRETDLKSQLIVATMEGIFEFSF